MFVPSSRLRVQNTAFPQMFISKKPCLVSRRCMCIGRFHCSCTQTSSFGSIKVDVLSGRVAWSINSINMWRMFIYACAGQVKGSMQSTSRDWTWIVEVKGRHPYTDLSGTTWQLAAEGGQEPKTLSRCHGLAGSDQQGGGVLSEDKKVDSSYCIMPTHYLVYGITSNNTFRAIVVNWASASKASGVLGYQPKLTTLA